MRLLFSSFTELFHNRYDATFVISVVNLLKKYVLNACLSLPVIVLQCFSRFNRNSLAKVEFSSSVFWRQRRTVWSVSSWSWWLYQSCQTGSPFWTGDLWSSLNFLEQLGMWSTGYFFLSICTYLHLWCLIKTGSLGHKWFLPCHIFILFIHIHINLHVWCLITT